MKASQHRTVSGKLKVLFTLVILILFSAADAQIQAFSKVKPGPPPGPPPPGQKPGNGSNNNGPKPHGMVMTDLTAANTTMFTPTGYGSSKSFAFVDFGGTPNQVYGTSPDLVAHLGAGIGDYRKNVSLAAFVTMNDVSKGDNFSYNFIASRGIGETFAVAAGATHLFADPVKTDGLASYYVAVSNHTKTMRSAGNPVLSYTVGYGTGRFLMKSERDYLTGKGTQGTGIFGSVSYGVSKTARLNAEWTGMNLAITSSVMVKPGLPSLYVGVTDLTRYTGDRPVFMIALGQTIGFGK